MATVLATLVISGGGDRVAVVPTPTASSSPATTSFQDGGPSMADGFPTFRLATTLPAEGRSASFAIDDLDGDTDVDLVVGVDATPDVLELLLGDGTGAFGGRDTITLDGTRAFGVDDLDGDGITDIIGVSTTGGTVSILYGLGRLGFEPPMVLRVGAGPRKVATIDVDGDGRTDLVTADADANQLSVIRTTGDRTFAAPVAVPAGDGPAVIAAGDFDLDGAVDLAVGSRGDGDVAIHWGAGDGTFTTHRSIPGSFDPVDIATIDVDGDGDLDLAVSNGGLGTVSVLLANPSGPFWDEQRLAIPDPTVDDRLGDVEIVDLDGDGALDVVVVDSGGRRLVVWPGEGAGSFGTPVSIGIAGRPLSVEIRDVDQDGRMDLVVAKEEPDAIDVMLAASGGTP